jgi:hypothetical protein
MKIGAVTSSIAQKLPSVGFGLCRRAVPLLVIERWLSFTKEAPAALAPPLGDMPALGRHE